jgi:hypothetical protein
MSKSDYLDPRWQKFRLQRLELAKWRCDVCCDKESTLHVHHRFYISGRKPWEYLPETTDVLCDECHKIQHDFSSDFETLGPAPWERTLELVLISEREFNPETVVEILKDANGIPESRLTKKLKEFPTWRDEL